MTNHEYPSHIKESSRARRFGRSLLHHSGVLGVAKRWARIGIFHEQLAGAEGSAFILDAIGVLSWANDVHEMSGGLRNCVARGSQGASCQSFSWGVGLVDGCLPRCDAEYPFAHPGPHMKIGNSLGMIGDVADPNNRIQQLALLVTAEQGEAKGSIHKQSVGVWCGIRTLLETYAFTCSGNQDPNWSWQAPGEGWVDAGWMTPLEASGVLDGALRALNAEWAEL